MRLIPDHNTSARIAYLRQLTAETACFKPSSLRVGMAVLGVDAGANSAATLNESPSTELGTELETQLNQRDARLTPQAHSVEASVDSEGEPSRSTARLPFAAASNFDSAASGKRCISVHNCISSVQSVARVRAVSRDEIASNLRDFDEKPVTTLRESAAVRSLRHEICSLFEIRRDFGHVDSFRFFFANEEKKRGTTSRVVPSQADSVPDFRDVIRCEWIVCQPSRRDSQCVPT